MSDDPIRPIRRSALEPAHAALGARWVDEHARWPLDYGDPEAERTAAATAAGLAEVGPLDKLVVRGAGAAGSVAELLPSAGAPAAEVWQLADDEVLVLAPGGAEPGTDDGGVLAPLAAAVRAAALVAADVGSGFAALRVAGPAARSILAEVCAVDLSERAVAEGDVVQAAVASVGAVVIRRDAAAGPGFTILVARDEVRYVWDVLHEIGAAHGLRPVGPGAVTPIAAGRRAGDVSSPAATLEVAG